MVIFATFGRHYGASMTFSWSSAVVAERSQPDRMNPSAMVPDSFGVWSGKILGNQSRFASYCHHSTCRIYDRHTSAAVAYTRLFFAGADRRSSEAFCIVQSVLPRFSTTRCSPSIVLWSIRPMLMAITGASSSAASVGNRALSTSGLPF